MPEPGEQPGATEESLGWEEALAANLAGQEETPVQDETPVVETPGDETVEESAADETPKDALEPLERWTDEVKTRFSALEPDVQQAWLDREAEVERYLTERSTELAEHRKRYEKLDEVLNPYDDVLKKQGVELAPHLAQALNYYFAFQQNPASTLKALIQQSQLTSEQLFGDETADPDIRALTQRLDQTTQELAQLKQGSTQQTVAAYQSQIDTFENEKDGTGALKHPYFERVRTLMAPLVDQGKTLEEAYAETVWSVPEYREAQSKAAADKAEKERREKADRERKTKIENARKAETMPSGDTEKGNGVSEFSGWQGALQETLAKME